MDRLSVLLSYFLRLPRLEGENRYASLDKTRPELSPILKKDLQEAYMERYALYKQLSDLPFPGTWPGKEEA